VPARGNMHAKAAGQDRRRKLDIPHEANTGLNG
jgi:hypothetical protein